MTRHFDHLDLSDDLLVITHFPTVYDELDEPIVLGPVESEPEWPSHLGLQPRWFLTESAWYLDQFLDSREFAEGCEATARGAYLDGIGA